MMEDIPARTHYCGDLRPENVGSTVTVKGWVHTARDHGGLIFIDLRDRTGLVQIAVDPERSQLAHRGAQRVRSEFVLAVRGEVSRRPEENVNLKIPTGGVEIRVTDLWVLNEAKTLPFAIEDESVVSDAVRMKYRYLDLRRPAMQRNFVLRHKANQCIRNFFTREGFLELETPVLTKSTPEGARDYLVPSRVNRGKFYALPQSPQIFKQLFMVSGFDRYFQIVKCFRDEDLRADRQPEFIQVDVEMSFAGWEDVFGVVEGLMADLFRECIGVEAPTPFPRLSYDVAMSRYGSDKPDLRYDLCLKDLSELVGDTEFGVFREVLEAGGRIKGLAAPGLASGSRKDLDDLTKFAIDQGAKGLAWMKVEEGAVSSPIAKFFKQATLDNLTRELAASPGDLLLMVADATDVTDGVLGALRVHIANRLYPPEPNDFKFVWVTDFPLLEWDEEEGRFQAVHHPFTSPRPEDIPLFDTDPGKIRASAYDLVLNGQEIGGGSIRIHHREIQNKMFQALGLSTEEAKEKFGFFLEALEFGTPPHGGIALGLDRIVAILAGVESIREVIAFPKTQRALDLMTDAPSPVDEKQLRELGIDVLSE
ncbi:MAG: aspartate--tRNA ligase [Nitrospinota bacterium]